MDVPSITYHIHVLAKSKHSSTDENDDCAKLAMMCRNGLQNGSDFCSFFSLSFFLNMDLQWKMYRGNGTTSAPISISHMCVACGMAADRILQYIIIYGVISYRITIILIVSPTYSCIYLIDCATLEHSFSIYIFVHSQPQIVERSAGRRLSCSAACARKHLLRAVIHLSFHHLHTHFHVSSGGMCEYVCVILNCVADARNIVYLISCSSHITFY